jgi:hypothetical protein
MAVDRRMFRRLTQSGFYERVGKNGPPYPNGLWFDDNHPSTGAVIKRSKALDRWKAPSR